MLEGTNPRVNRVLLLRTTATELSMEEVAAAASASSDSSVKELFRNVMS
jgi:hypothetical protein